MKVSTMNGIKASLMAAAAACAAVAALATGPLFAAATATVGEVEMKTYPFGDPDPVPATAAKRYPYFRYDRTSSDGAPAKWKTVTLENDNIRVIMLPQVGGKVWTATDKRTGRDFLFANHAMKFRDIAIRGPWTAGGIEFNFGVLGHAPSAGTPVDWCLRENPDGSASYFAASHEFITRTWWQVEVRLPKDADEFETRVVWYNASGLPAPYYHWMNAAYSVQNDPQFLFPGRDVVGHQGEVETRDWPRMIVGGKTWKVDDMPGNEWGGPKSYHVLPGNNGFYGVWWRGLGFGSYHRSEPYEKFGRKIWLQTMSPYGLLWMKYKTDSDGQNAELQSGRCFNQPRGGTYKTPFKHRLFAPGQTETFTEKWGPIRDLKDVAGDLAADRPAPKARPVEAPGDFDWNSAWGEYVRGTQAIAEREDALGIGHLEKAVAKDRFLGPAYAALAAAELRRGDYAKAHTRAAQALALDAYDALANYADGFAYFAEGDQTTARERLGVAAMNPEYRAPALALIARGYLRDGDAAAAKRAAEKALAANGLEIDALLARAVAMRGEDAAARRRFLEETLARLPLRHEFRYELSRAGGEKDFARYVANELPAETYLELGSWYEETGLEEDARRFFALAGTNMVAKIRLGDFAAAKALPAAGVFPFRRETLPALARAAKEDGHWKFRYLLAVVKAHYGCDAEADALLDGCGDEPDEAVFYQYRATRREGGAARRDMMRAKSIADSWRVGRQLAEHDEKAGNFTEVLRTADDYLARFPGVNPLQIAKGRALLKLKRYGDCLKYLSTVKLLPSEHRGTATDIWHEAQDALGIKRTWPENLGKGEPYPDAKEKVDVLVIQGGCTTNKVDRMAVFFADYFREVADSLSLTSRKVEESALPDDLRAAADAVVLGYNGKVSSATLAKLRAFSAAGGRLLVACRLPKGVGEILGVKEVGRISQGDALDPELAGILPEPGRLPPADRYAAFTRWADYDAPVVALAGPGEIAARWAREGGAPREEPAVVVTPKGVFVSYLWFRGGSPMQRDLLEGVFRRLLPGKAIARKPDRVSKADDPAPVPPNEHRGIWCHARGLAASGKNWDETCALLKARGVTDVYVLLAWGGGAFYESKVLPVAPHVAKYGDQLKLLVAGAHRHGIRCHAWKVHWRIDHYADKELVARERAVGKLQVGIDGSLRDWYCPSDPENRAREAAVMEELAKSGVDGIHFDFIRFKTPRICFCPRCRSQFEAIIGRKIEKWPTYRLWPNDPDTRKAWLTFREDVISKTVEEASRRARAANPKITISAAVCALKREQSWIGQNAALWLDKGWVDYVCPMDYDCKDATEMRELAAQQNSVAPGRVYPGIGMAAWTYPGGDAAKLEEMRDAVRAAGCAGSTIYVLDDDRAEFVEKWW